MKKGLLLTLAGVALALTGCKSGIDVPVKFSKLQVANETVTANLYLEVPACKDPNSGLDSTQLLEAKQKVAFVLKGSEYKSCSRDGFSSIAQFTVPVQIGTQTLDPKEGISVGFWNNQVIYVFVSEAVRGQLKKVMGRSFGFNPNDFAVTVWVKNDSGKQQDFRIPSALLKQEGYKPEPLHQRNVGLKPGSIVGFQLSNIASMSLLDENGPGNAEALRLLEPIK
jgi:hypothetical protein